MRKLIFGILTLVFFVNYSVAQEFGMLQKQVFCGQTRALLDNLEKNEYVQIAKSTMYVQNSQVGSVLFFIKDDELLIVDSFEKTSCVIIS